MHKANRSGHQEPCDMVTCHGRHGYGLEEADLPHLFRLYADPRGTRETSSPNRSTPSAMPNSIPVAEVSGLQGCGTAHAQPWATHHSHHPIATQMTGKPVCCTGHAQPSPTIKHLVRSIKGLWCASGPGLTCDSHGSDPVTWQGSKKSTGERKTPEQAVQIGLAGKDQGRADRLGCGDVCTEVECGRGNCGIRRTQPPSGPLILPYHPRGPFHSGSCQQSPCEHRRAALPCQTHIIPRNAVQPWIRNGAQDMLASKNIHTQSTA